MANEQFVANFGSKLYRLSLILFFGKKFPKTLKANLDLVKKTD